MPYYDEEWLKELHSKINIEQVVSSYVELKSKGGRLWGCCPFHTEKTPSFTVDAGRGFYHCFGCGKGGNVIQFIMEAEHLTFPEACAHLGDLAGMEPPKNNGARKETSGDAKKRICEINKAAAYFYHETLNEKSSTLAGEYLFKRGIDRKLQKIYGIGFAPDKWDCLLRNLKSKGYAEEELVAAGLAKRKDGNCFDVFRGRIMFPIINQYSQVIGFGGRVTDGGEPKYLNTSDTAVFNKRQNLYNINVLRALKDLRHIILVEGYIDAIALGKYGVKNSAATLGTALTSEQALLIKRFADTVYISYDGDEAGQKASLRAADILDECGINCRVVVIPDRKDPDEYLKEYGREAYLTLLSDSMSAMEFRFEMKGREYNLADDMQKEDYIRACVNLLKSEKSAVLREKYAGYLSEKTGFSQSSILRDIENAPAKKPLTVNFSQDANKTAHDGADSDRAAQTAEDVIISLLCSEPRARGQLLSRLSTGVFDSELNIKIFSYLSEEHKKGKCPKCDEILSMLQNQDERVQIIKLLEQYALQTDTAPYGGSFLQNCIARLLIRKKQRDIDEYIKRGRQANSVEEKKEIYSQIGALNKEIYILRAQLARGG